ncbi:hypothetical protein CLV36_103203 [Laceyella sediminis]|uniref:Glycerophosphoryl diester phosphodiesterase family protein n=1 Tax=Laceyella sediminis TaxID=573074 RepID=A0ABX5ERU3_9BACL|nr:hypothetical protein [Laceyella sediminis]PRZ15977.1 hypothetical protein CLV36_103203 [Laceyella sediminis]
MEHIKKHGFKLAWIQLLGMIVLFVMYLGAMLVYYLISLALGLSNIMANTNPFESAAQLGTGLITLSIVLYLGLLAVEMIIGAMSTGAIYGISIEAVFNNRVTLSLYFHHMFRHIKRLTLLSLTTFLLLVPFIIAIVVISVIAIANPHDVGAISLSLAILAFVVYSLFIIAITIFAPIMIIHEKKPVWESIKLSAKLWGRAFGRSLSAVLSAFFITLLIVLGYLLLMLCFALLTGVSFGNGLNGLGSMSMIFLVIFWIFFFIFILPLASVSFYLILIGRYKKRLRPVLFPAQKQEAPAEAQSGEEKPADANEQSNQPSDM